MPDLRRPPDFRHVFKTTDGEVLIVPHRDARRVIDRRSDQAPLETCWEVVTASGLVRTLWPSDILDWSQEEL